MPETAPTFDIQAFRNALVEWFRREGKDYPWRRTEDPWHILVSELMLQQTTIPTVLGRYELWMHRFPTPHHLAAVDEQTALRSWEGLGYYRRVRSLQAIAREIVTSFGGTFPSDKEGLKKLPGIGPYTSGALLSFAFNKPAPIVDANVARVLSRIDNYSTAVDSTEGTEIFVGAGGRTGGPGSCAGIQLRHHGTGADLLPDQRAGLPALPRALLLYGGTAGNAARQKSQAGNHAGGAPRHPLHPQ